MTFQKKEKLRKRMLGNKINLGRKLTQDEIEKIRVGIIRAYDKKGRKQHKRYIHFCNDIKYRKWRSGVFEKDNWICQTCGARSKAGEPVYLEAHHIKGWADYPTLRYDVENGVTLCLKCHRLTRKKTL